jgi:hypothetical protein
MRMVYGKTVLFLENTHYYRQKTVFSVEKSVSGLAIAIKNRCSPNGPKLSGNVRMRMVNGIADFFLRNTHYYGQKTVFSVEKSVRGLAIAIKIDVLQTVPNSQEICA